MDDRAADLRREALKCLELARIAISPIVRQEMVAMAARLNEIANSTSADFAVILQAYNDGDGLRPGRACGSTGTADSAQEGRREGIGRLRRHRPQHVKIVAEIEFHRSAPQRTPVPLRTVASASCDRRLQRSGRLTAGRKKPV